MDLIDLLEREWTRFQRDFRNCAVTQDKDERRRRGQALVQRVAAYLLAQEKVLHPALRGLDESVLHPLREEHGRLKWRVADALLAYCGAEDRAYRSLRKTQRQLRSHGRRMREDLYPLLHRFLSRGRQQIVGESMLHWLEAHRSQPSACRVLPSVGNRSSGRALPAWLDASRLPVLRQVVLLPGAAAPGAGLR